MRTTCARNSESFRFIRGGRKDIKLEVDKLELEIKMLNFDAADRSFTLASLFLIFSNLNFFIIRNYVNLILNYMTCLGVIKYFVVSNLRVIKV